MKSANAYGRPSSAAQIALCGEDPSSHGSGRSGRPGQEFACRADVVRRQLVFDQGEQLAELLGEVVGRGVTAVALEREHRHRVGAGRAAEAEVDPAGIEAGRAC